MAEHEGPEGGNSWRGLGQLQPDPADAGLTETALTSERIWQGKLLDVRRDTVRLPNGNEATREYIRHAGAVMVIPLLDDEHAVMERQHRHATGGVLLEFPAGKLDPGESPLVSARRELAEETGYRATHWARAGLVHTCCAYSTEGIDVWFAKGLQAGSTHTDEGEFIEVLTCSVHQLDALAARGEVTDAKTLIGLLWWQRWLAGRWVLDWQRVPTEGGR